MSIDDQFFSTYEIPFVAGDDFSEEDRFSFPNHPNISTVILPRDKTFYPERNKIIINEALSKKLGFSNPDDAIHQKVRFGLWDEFTGEIAGVVKNYHQQSLNKNYEPIFYFYGDFENWPSISIRLKTTSLPKRSKRSIIIMQQLFREILLNIILLMNTLINNTTLSSSSRTFSQ